MTVHPLVESLNPPQREAVTVPGGPALVLAGPGSGKTRVLTHRAAYLVSALGVAPWRIMAVTFTNKAAREMGSRVAELAGEDALSRMTLGTFHAICARILRIESETLGFGSDYVIFDSDDQLRAVKRTMSELNIDEKQYRPRSVLGAISDAKNELIRPEDYTPQTYWHEMAGRAYERYQEILRACNALDFDDLLVETAFLMAGNAEVRDKYQRRYEHVLVDEFQDTNTAQYALLKSLTAAADSSAPRNLFVVGDEDQSIYRWRGADYRNIQRLRRDYPDARTILLEQNYRSTQTILNAARAVIDANPQRTPKELWTEHTGGALITLFEAYDEGEEAAYVIRSIERELTDGRSFGDIAVMYRTNAQSRVIEDAFVRRGMPYQLVGATRFYDRREVRDAMAFLRLVYNPLDEVSLQRVINVPPRGIGPRAWALLGEWSASMAAPRWAALEAIAAGERDLAGASTVDTRAANALTAFHRLLADLIAASNELPPAKILKLALEQSGYEAWLRDGTEEGETRWENVMELSGVAADYDSLPPREGLGSMLESVALVTDVDNLADTADRVTVLTLHSAKGLEFPVVFITGLEENILPHSRSVDEPESLAEERRLFYVGVTRAERKLYLIHAFRRTIFGSSDTRDPSRFLNDIPPSLVEGSGASSTSGRVGAARQTSWPTEAPRKVSVRAPGTSDVHVATGGFRAGDKVRHHKFGPGVVVSSTERDGDEEVTVAFTDGGVKKLLQSFAKLEKA